MDAILYKSQLNLTAADCLINESCKIASAHSAYYSLFFLMRYLLNKELGFNYAQQEQLSKDDGSHNKICKEFISRLNNEKDFEPNDTIEWYNKVKMIRTKADYKPTKIPEKILKDNIQDTHSFINIINEHFKLF